MRTARLLTEDGPLTGEYVDGVVHADDGQYVVGRDGRLLPPCEPTALYCVGRNYAATNDQMDYDRPEEPDFFIKPPTSLLAHEQDISYPPFTDELTYAGELAAVIGERCHDIDPADVPDAVAGYTILNDVDALDQQGRTARKAFDGSGPWGHGSRLMSTPPVSTCTPISTTSAGSLPTPARCCSVPTRWSRTFPSGSRSVRATLLRSAVRPTRGRSRPVTQSR